MNSLKLTYKNNKYSVQLNGEEIAGRISGLELDLSTDCVPTALIKMPILDVEVDTDDCQIELSINSTTEEVGEVDEE